MAPSSHWILALTEILYFAPSTLPLLYLLYTHRSGPLTSTWVFLLLFTLLQLIGSAMILHAGPHGTPSAVATILVQVGLSPLVIALSSGVHAYAKMAGVVPEGRTRTKVVLVGSVVFHLAVLGAIAIYAVGASDSFRRPRPGNAAALYEAGVLLLLALFIVLCAFWTIVAAKTPGTHTTRALFWSTTVSLLLLAVRIVYSTVAAFRVNDPQFNPVNGQIVYEIVLVFLPGALIVAAMFTGGAMTTDVEVLAYTSRSKEGRRGGPEGLANSVM